MSRLRLAIADDELNIIELIQKMIDPQIAEVSGISMNGIDAYNLVCEHKTDILITDIRMPGYSGLELIEKVKKVSPATDIIVISGYREFEYLQTILKYGVLEFLLKPVDKEELNAAIRRLAQRRIRETDHNQYVADMELNLISSYTQLREKYTLELLNGVKCLNNRDIPKNLFMFREGKYCVLVLKLDCYIDASNSEIMDIPYINTLLMRYRDTIAIALIDECFDASYVTVGNSVIFIFNYDNTINDETFFNWSRFEKHNIADMLTMEHYKYGFIHLTLGVGISVKRLDDVGKSYRTALEAVGNRIAPGSMSVIGGKETDVLTVQVLNQIDLERLSSIITALDFERITEFIKEKMKALSQSGKYPLLYSFATEVLEFTRTYIFTNKIISEKEYQSFQNINERANNCFTQEMLSDCLLHYFNELFCQIREICQKRATKSIRLAIDYMRQNYAKPITLQSVAEAIYYSPNYFSAAFKKETGKTFLEYLTQIRIEEAEEMLKNTRKSISEIASLIGYSDEKYFSKLFTKAVGIRPNEYRKFYS